VPCFVMCTVCCCPVVSVVVVVAGVAWTVAFGKAIVVAAPTTTIAVITALTYDFIVVMSDYLVDDTFKRVVSKPRISYKKL
jgi:hypothetical protein